MAGVHKLRFCANLDDLEPLSGGAPVVWVVDTGNWQLQVTREVVPADTTGIDYKLHCSSLINLYVTKVKQDYSSPECRSALRDVGCSPESCSDHDGEHAPHQEVWSGSEQPNLGNVRPDRVCKTKQVSNATLA